MKKLVMIIIRLITQKQITESQSQKSFTYESRDNKKEQNDDGMIERKKREVGRYMTTTHSG